MAVAFSTSPAAGFRPKGDLIYFGVADEEAGGTWGAEWCVDHTPTRSTRLRAHRDRRLVARRPARPRAVIGQHRREGHRLAAAPRARHAGPRLDAVRCRQRPRQGGRDRAPARRATGPRRSISDALDRAGRGHGAPRRPDAPAARRPGPHRRRPRDAARRRIARSCHARTHTTFSPNVVARRAEDERRSPTRSISTSTSAPCRATPATTSTRMLAEALGDLAAPRRDQPSSARRRDHVAARHAAVGRDRRRPRRPPTRVPISCRA